MCAPEIVWWNCAEQINLRIIKNVVSVRENHGNNKTSYSRSEILIKSSTAHFPASVLVIQ